MRKYIMDFYPNKAQFIKGEEIELTLEIFNTYEAEADLKIQIDFSFLDKVICKKIFNLRLESQEERNITVTMDGKDDDFKGYGVDAYVYQGNQSLQQYSTSFDIVSSWKNAIRYGFLSDFYINDKEDKDDIKNLRKLHINTVQFYDWMYRHDKLVCDKKEYKDLMGRTLSLDTVINKIKCCHEYGMKAMAYGAVYAAGREFFEKHPTWALYNSSGKPLCFINIFYIMNVSRECPWHDHIINEYKSAIEKVDFDGIHMDTYGFPKKAVSRVNGVKLENMDKLYPLLIDDTREELEKIKEETELIFNNVGNWPVNSVAKAKQDAVYVEVWPPYERYHHIADIIARCKLVSDNKTVILAAYLKPFINCKDIRNAENSALILTAAITSKGAYHLLLGEKNGVLTQGYYVDYSVYDTEFNREIRNYYDFIVRYSNIFYDDNLKDVSMTHVGGDNREYIFNNFKYSTYGEGDKVWVSVKENEDRKVISFINLCGNDDDYWNTEKLNPEIINDMEIKIMIDYEVKTVFAASPDFDMGIYKNLDYKIEKSENGAYIIIKIPPVYIWTVLSIEFDKDVILV